MMQLREHANHSSPIDQARQLEQAMVVTLRNAQSYIEKIIPKLEALSSLFEEEEETETRLQNSDEEAHDYLLRDLTEEEQKWLLERAEVFVNLYNILSILKTGTPSVYPVCTCHCQILSIPEWEE